MTYGLILVFEELRSMLSATTRTARAAARHPGPARCRWAR